MCVCIYVCVHVCVCISVGCSAIAQDLLGSAVKEVVTAGSSDAEKDAACCAQCSADKECEFWVRSTVDDKCWLRKGFAGYAASSDHRGAHRSTKQHVIDNFQ